MFQLAILDIKMFPLDGVVLLGEIKSRRPSIEVIMITAYPTVDTRNECMKKGASTYLTKPVDIQELKDDRRWLAVPLRESDAYQNSSRAHQLPCYSYGLRYAL